jgi:hypothetical protein
MFGSVSASDSHLSRGEGTNPGRLGSLRLKTHVELEIIDVPV